MSFSIARSKAGIHAAVALETSKYAQPGFSTQVDRSGIESANSGRYSFKNSIIQFREKSTNLTLLLGYLKREENQFTHFREIPLRQGTKDPPQKDQQKLPPSGFIISFIIVVSTLILVLLFASHVRQLERKMHGKK
ncbi:MAG: hypothetical protein KGM98_13855 [Bacteroidota bacterium]|nr:hypothetical protein [Bacteroidota bacterium]